MYTNCIGLSFDKSTEDGADWNSAQQGLDENDRTAWVPPVAIDPEHHNTLYFGTYRVYQTTDGAAQWNPISGDLTGTSGKSVLNAIAIAPTDANTIYAGSGDGRVHVTRNALSGASSKWTDVTSSSLPNRSVNWIAVDPTIATTAYVGFSGFSGYGDHLGHIFKTVNAGPPGPTSPATCPTPPSTPSWSIQTCRKRSSSAPISAPSTPPRVAPVGASSAPACPTSL